MTADRTPGPYTVRPSASNASFYVEAPGGSGPWLFAEVVGHSREVNEANARFIARACNSHDALAYALELAQGRLEHDGDCERLLEGLAKDATCTCGLDFVEQAVAAALADARRGA